jgi:hypothetical protein
MATPRVPEEASVAPFSSTADYLIAFRGELLAGNVPVDVANEMVISASRHLIQEAGLGVHKVSEEVAS